MDLSLEKKKAAYDNFLAAQLEKPRDRPYRMLPFNEGDTNSPQWMKICRVFHIMNLPTVKERSQALYEIKQTPIFKELDPIFKFYEDYFRKAV